MDQVLSAPQRCDCQILMIIQLELTLQVVRESRSQRSGYIYVCGYKDSMCVARARLGECNSFINKRQLPI